MENNVRLFMTTSADSMFKETDFAAVETAGVDVSIHIEEDLEYQEIDGFGASFTDSSAYLINQVLSNDDRSQLLEKLFDPSEGIGLSYTRTPMGSSDFARFFYSFDDLPTGETDRKLDRFSIDHDKRDIIPLLKRAKELNGELKIMSSPWSPPGWMKTSGHMIGGKLKPEYYGVYADYFVKYIQAYKAAGLKIDAVTPQNEPCFTPHNYPGCEMTAAEQADLIKNALYPAFQSVGLDTKIFCFDHNWNEAHYPAVVLCAAAEYTDGVAWHWYGGDVAEQTRLHDKYPDKEVYLTEASGGEWIPLFESAFMAFMLNGIDILNNWSRSYILWNFALDENNGPVVPGFAENERSTCRGVVTINRQTGALTYNPDYFALAHFSKFIRPKARRVACDGGRAVACKNVDGSLCIVAANNADDAVVRFHFRGLTKTIEMPTKSAATIILNR
jgi:glucosylceramidase